MANEITIRLRSSVAHPKQNAFIHSEAKRKIIRAGRRSGKTTGSAVLGVMQFLDGRRVLYATPTAEQIARFWSEIKTALEDAIRAGVFIKNETFHTIELPGTEQRIGAKTAWNADTLRGDYADLLILDEWQLMNEDTWEIVGAPMLLDNDGDAVFIYTPPSLHSRSVSKANDPLHAAKLFKRMEQDTSGRSETFSFSSHDNPHISVHALSEITKDMTHLAYRQEILAEDVEDVLGALWKHSTIDVGRVREHPDLSRVVVGVDPPGGVTECGIVVAGTALCSCRGKAEFHAFVIEDSSIKAPPDVWAASVVSAYRRHEADRVLGETNFGGDMVESTLRTADRTIRYTKVSASRGKAVRAEPISALYEQGKVHHVGYLRAVHDKSPGLLEDEMCGWVPGMAKSPNRVDALVWALTHLMDRPVTCLSDGMLLGRPRPPELQPMPNPGRMKF
jgi:Terminase RNaseH-like domain